MNMLRCSRLIYLTMSACPKRVVIGVSTALVLSVGTIAMHEGATTRESWRSWNLWDSSLRYDFSTRLETNP